MRLLMLAAITSTVVILPPAPEAELEHIGLWGQSTDGPH